MESEGLKIDFHVHTGRSTDAYGSPGVVAKAAKKAGLDGIAITDHNKLFPNNLAKELAKDYGLLVIPGVECGNILYGKHSLLINVSDIPDQKDIYSRLEAVDERCGVSIAPHPNSPRCGYTNFYKLPFTGYEVFNCGSKTPVKGNGSFQAKIGSSDTHFPFMMGYRYTLVDAPTGSNSEEVLEAIRKCKCQPAGVPVPSRYDWFHRITAGPIYAIRMPARVLSIWGLL